MEVPAHRGNPERLAQEAACTWHNRSQSNAPSGDCAPRPLLVLPGPPSSMPALRHMATPPAPGVQML